MQTFNKIILEINIAIIDFLYQGRDYQRFWVLEEIARAPYFAFLSVLHFRESMGLRGRDHIDLMIQHFEQSVNETSHLEYMESMGGNSYWIDRFVAKHLVLIYYWINVVYYWMAPRAAYHLSYEIELHAAETYEKYLAYEDYNDKDIWRIMNDEIQHFQELAEAMRILDPDHLTVREKDREPFPPDVSDLLKSYESCSETVK